MFKKTTAPVSSIDYLTSPMARDELKWTTDHDELGRVEAVVSVSLSDVACGDYEDLLDLLTERICGENGLLSDICFSVVGADTDTGEVLVKVSGEWDEL